jgi:membrane protein implicated in regulation of membrane protease activity
MHIVAIAWVFVVGLLALVEATSARGSLLGALATLVFYGAVPLAIVLYVLGTPARRRARARRESSDRGGTDPHRGDHAPGDAVAPEREEP